MPTPTKCPKTEATIRRRLGNVAARTPPSDQSDADADAEPVRGAVKLTMDELVALQHGPHIDIAFYLHLRFKMDFATGKVGVGKYRVCWGRMAALLRIQPHPGTNGVNVTIDEVRGCGERLRGRGLLHDATQGRRLGFALPLAIADRNAADDGRECFRISGTELDQLTGLPHRLVVLYLYLRRLMDPTDGMVGLQERVSWEYLAELLRVDGNRGRRAQRFSIDQVRRMAERLATVGLLHFRSEDRQLMFELPVAYRDFHASQQAARRSPDTATRSPSSGKPRARTNSKSGPAFRSPVRVFTLSSLRRRPSLTGSRTAKTRKGLDHSASRTGSARRTGK